MHRRTFMKVAGAAASSLAVQSAALARDWDDPASVRYPDPAVEVIDPRFAKYKLGNAAVERLYTGNAVGGGSCLVRRRAVPALERYSQQSDYALGRGDRQGQRFPQTLELQ